MMKRQTFTKAFKAEAVRLLEQSGKPAADLARELGAGPENGTGYFPWEWFGRSPAKSEVVRSFASAGEGERARGYREQQPTA